MPILAVGAATIAAQNGWGLMNLVALPTSIKIILAIILLDGAIYAQHVATHKIPLLWRLHKVHHADRDIDVTTGARFHPIEILISMLYKIVVVIALGAPAVAVFIFEVILNASAMFNHANWKMPQPLDKVLRLLIVTPDMHRVHHSVIHGETDSNYGFFLSVWDRLFGTYIPQPKAGHDEMVIGLDTLQSPDPGTLIWSLTAPFQNESAHTNEAPASFEQ